MLCDHGSMNLEEGWLEYMDTRTFIYYLYVKIRISRLPKMEHPQQKDLEIYTPESQAIVNSFVHFAIAMYNYFRRDEALTFERVNEQIQALVWDDVWTDRELIKEE